MDLQLIRVLGHGHFGEVWLARDLGLERDVAVKMLDLRHVRPGDDVFNEARALLASRHPNVVDVLGAEMFGGIPAIAMEYLADGSVEARYQGHPVPVRRALKMVTDACRGVGHAHAMDLLHRDIKPANLLLNAQGDVKLSDFGLACSANDVHSGPATGYRPHLPPEAVAQHYISTPSGDIYALGVTLYRLLNGDAHLYAAIPPGADGEALIVAGKFPDRDAFLPHIPESVRRVVRRAMHRDPDKRPADAATLRYEIEKVLPIVSFRCSAPDSPWTGPWIGEGAGVEWSVEVVRNATAAHFGVAISRSTQGKRRRKKTELCAEGLETMDMALLHATGAMNEISGGHT